MRTRNSRPTSWGKKKIIKFYKAKAADELYKSDTGAENQKMCWFQIDFYECSIKVQYHMKSHLKEVEFHAHLIV